MRVLFLGTPSLAVPTLRLLASSEEFRPLAVFTQPAARRSRRGRAEPSAVGKAARNLGLECHEVESVNRDAPLARMRELAPDVIVVVAFGQILKRVVLELPRYGCLNFHPSMLPAWRGAAPVQRAVMGGAVDSGLTIMRLVRKLDAGPVLLQQPWRMDPEKNAGELLEEAGNLGAPMMLEALRNVATGATAEPQDNEQATYAPPLTKEDAVLDFSKPCRVLHNQVRGVQPWPRAQAWLKRDHPARLIIHRTEVGEGEGEPGEITGIDESGIAVACSNGVLRLREVQLEGKPPRSARDVANGMRLKVGERFLVGAAPKASGQLS